MKVKRLERRNFHNKENNTKRIIIIKEGRERERLNESDKKVSFMKGLLNCRTKKM